MAESAIVEKIIPGTYIAVHAEGLLSVGGIATGNIGILGTAEMGDPSRTEILSDFEGGRALFGEPGDWDRTPGAQNLSLVRAMRLLFDNGARTVYARRVLHPGTARTAVCDLLGTNNAPLLRLRAKTPGTWGNRLQIRVEAAEAPELVGNERVTPASGAYVLSAQRLLPPGADNPSIGTVVVEDNLLTNRFQLQQGAASRQIVQVNPATRILTFAQPPSATAEIRVSYWVPIDGLRKITLRYGNRQEVYTVPSMAYFVQLLTDEQNPSQLVTVEGSIGAGLPNVTSGFQEFLQGENGSLDPRDLRTLYQDALDALVEQNIQILVVVGIGFSDIQASVLGHVEKTENIGHERIAVLGADTSVPEKIVENANSIADKRVVLVAPGLQDRDARGQIINLPTYFTAAAVAGKLSALAPNISLTNKTLAGIEGLQREYNYGEMKLLVQNRVLALERKRGIRIVKGISTDDGAFRQISIRRIVDYAKEGTRIGANQYIGLLNNGRVRQNLKTTLDGFLGGMLRDEFLTDYKLDVSATRRQEIDGEVEVKIAMKPTFSIDYVLVVMNLE